MLDLTLPLSHCQGSEATARPLPLTSPREVPALAWAGALLDLNRFRRLLVAAPVHLPRRTAKEVPGGIGRFEATLFPPWRHRNHADASTVDLYGRDFRFEIGV